MQMTLKELKSWNLTQNTLKSKSENQSSPSPLCSPRIPARRSPRRFVRRPAARPTRPAATRTCSHAPLWPSRAQEPGRSGAAGRHQREVGDGGRTTGGAHEAECPWSARPAGEHGARGAYELGCAAGELGCARPAREGKLEHLTAVPAELARQSARPAGEEELAVRTAQVRDRWSSGAHGRPTRTWIQIGRRLGEANGWVKELERRVTMTGRSRPLWCSGAVGKKVVGCVPEGAGGGASKPDSAMERTVVAAQPRPLYRKRSAHHQTEVPVILIEQEAPTGDGEPATPRPSKRIPVLCTHLVRWSLFSVPCTTPDEDGEQWRNCAAHVYL